MSFFVCPGGRGIWRPHGEILRALYFVKEGSGSEKCEAVVLMVLTEVKVKVALILEPCRKCDEIE